jgi:hypothetical protein
MLFATTRKPSLTRSCGLKHYSELTVGERVLSVTTDGRTVIDRVTAIHASPYDGELLYFAGRSVDLLVTPNHRMLFMGRGQISNRWQPYMSTAEAPELAGRTVFALPPVFPMLRGALNSRLILNIFAWRIRSSSRRRSRYRQMGELFLILSR